MADLPEPWLRNTRTAVWPLPRAVLHALDLASENIGHYTPLLTDEEIHTRPLGLTPYAFHVRHIAHSLDRLLTYAEGEPLNVIQRAALHVELEPGITRAAMMSEFASALREAEQRIRALPLAELPEARTVGTARLPSTLAGLMVHMADHTQRHAGQAVTTGQLLLALRPANRA